MMFEGDEARPGQSMHVDWVANAALRPAGPAVFCPLSDRGERPNPVSPVRSSGGEPWPQTCIFVQHLTRMSLRCGRVRTRCRGGPRLGSRRAAR